jgi:hypothetical protein
MHIQAKATPAKSPPNLEEFVAVLSSPVTPPGDPTRQPINIEGVSGAELETGGQIVFSFDHDRKDDVEAWLREAEYKDVTFFDRDAGEIFWAELTDNVPGALLEAIREASSTTNVQDGKLIKHMVIGQETQAPHRFYVQISFQEVKTAP